MNAFSNPAFADQGAKQKKKHPPSQKKFLFPFSFSAGLVRQSFFSPFLFFFFFISFFLSHLYLFSFFFHLHSGNPSFIGLLFFILFEYFKSAIIAEYSAN
jgi:hypothetical protein